MTLPSTFWSKTTRTDCIVWSGAQNSKGYGCYGVAGKSELAHRVAWEDVNGLIPEDMTIDHRCRVRACVNVEHMEIVSIAENTRRRFRAAGGLDVGGQCKRGHEMTELNLYIRPSGSRDCKDCMREIRAERKASA